MALSRERIADELRKLLSVANPAPAVQAMLDHGIFATFLPEIVATQGQACTTDRAGTAVRIRPLGQPQVERNTSRRCRNRRENRRTLEAVKPPCAPTLMHLAINAKSDQSARQLAYAIGLENARDLVLLNSEHQRLARGASQSAGLGGPGTARQRR
jgi:tRNA nucleotidyltransferase/poly(A) polymerase